MAKIVDCLIHRILLTVIKCVMFLPVFQDLIKPQWRSVLETLKLTGGMPVSDLAREVDASYMAVKQHCEELKKLGYLDRSRIPRTAVGRPEIFYSLSVKADAVFPQAVSPFTLELLDELKNLLGESTPDKLLFQHFQILCCRWQPIIDKEDTIAEKVSKLVMLRRKEGGYIRTRRDPGGILMIEEYHNPLQRLFECYPRALSMEQRMIEQLLGLRVTRHESDVGRAGQPRVVFCVTDVE